MANFPGLILTDAGRDILAKALTGQTLTFTRVGLGDGTEPATPETLTALVNELQTVSIQAFEMIGDGTSKIRAILTNVGITTGFFVREIGVFAQDPDTLQEVLYSYANSGTQSDFLPAEGGATIVEQVFDLFTVVDTATTVTAVIDDYITLATKADIEEIRPYILPTGGLAGQLVRKRTNAEGDTEWFDPADGLGIRVASIAETRTAIEGQTVFNLSETRTNGLAVYVEGVRLRADEWLALNATQVQLDTALTVGTKVEFINNEEVGSVGVSSVTLDGPDLVFPGSSNTYTITNYDAFSIYAVATDVGTVTRTDETITLTIDAGQASGALNLSVDRNGASVVFQIAIGDQSVAQPEILNPAAGATDVGSGVILTTSAFVTYPNGADTHASTDWQVATDAGFTAIVFESLADASNLESIAVPSGTFDPSTTYYTRARHNGTTLGASPYSATVSFTTKVAFFPSTEVAKLLASDGAAGAAFGKSVAVYGSYGAVGADLQGNVGAVYVYERDGAGNWTQVQKLVAADSGVYDYFGKSISLFDTRLIVGAIGDDDKGASSGSAYVFERDGAGNWTQVAKLLASDGASSDQFGQSVSVSGDFAVIGAHTKSSSTGAAYIFERDGAGAWSQVAKLTASDAAASDEFGYSVAISGAYIVVGARNEGGTGAAYIFERDGLGAWSQVAKITASDAASGDQFGSSCSVSGGAAIIGAIGETSNKGAAYIFDRDGAGNWAQVIKVSGTGSSAAASFGQSVSIDSDYAVVGARVDDPGGLSNAGAAYLFGRDGSGNWVQISQILASDAVAGDVFGESVSLSGSYLFVGASGRDDLGSGSGAAYVYE